MFFFAPECNSCINSLKSLVSVLDRNFDQIPVLLMTGGHGDYLQDVVIEMQSDRLLYRDVQEILRKEHQLSLARVYFTLDEDWSVLTMGTSGMTEDFFDALIHPHKQ